LTAPPFTRILPAASRLTTIELSEASPDTVSTPLLNVAVVAALAGAAIAASAPAAAIPASRPRVPRRRALWALAFMKFSFVRRRPQPGRQGGPLSSGFATRRELIRLIRRTHQVANRFAFVAIGPGTSQTTTRYRSGLAVISLASSRAAGSR